MDNNTDLSGIYIRFDKLFFEFGLVTILFILINVTCQITQPEITYNLHKGWDGAFYYDLAKQFSAGLDLRTDSPFVFRPGTPFLVSLLSQGDLLISFKIVNIAGNFISVILLVILLRFFILNMGIRITLIALFMLNWISPVRFVYFYPCLTDSWLFVFLISGLILIQRYRNKKSVFLFFSITLVSAIGVFFRDTAMIIPIASIFVVNPIATDSGWKRILSNRNILQCIKSIPFTAYLPLIAGIFTYWMIHFNVKPTNSYDFLFFAVKWFLNKPVWIYILGWFIAFGPILIILLYHLPWLGKFLKTNQSLLVYLLGLATLAWMGGTDTERIIFWASPAVLILLGIILQDMDLPKYLPVLVLIAVLQLVSMRVFWILPDYPNSNPSPFPILTIPANNFQYFDLYSYYGRKMYQNAFMAEYTLLTFIMLGLFRFLTKKGDKPNQTNLQQIRKP